MDALGAGGDRRLASEGRLHRGPAGRVGLRTLNPNPDPYPYPDPNPSPSPNPNPNQGAWAFWVYAGWWYSFPTEGGVRRHWRSSRTPDWQPLRTTATLLLRALGIARLEPTLREIMQDRPLTVPPG